MTSSNATDFENTFQAALRASKENKSQLAIEFFQHALKINPAAAECYLLLGAELVSIGHLIAGEEAFSNALILMPDMHICRFQLGLLQFTSGRASLALVTWQPLLNLSDENPLKVFVFGFAQMAQNKFEEAIHFFEQGILLNQSNLALNTDIQHVIARIKEQIPPPPLLSSSEIKESGEESKDDSVSQMHFFLANYQQQGSIH